jgi:hypothetical protein
MKLFLTNNLNIFFHGFISYNLYKNQLKTIINIYLNKYNKFFINCLIIIYNLTLTLIF